MWQAVGGKVGGGAVAACRWKRCGCRRCDKLVGQGSVPRGGGQGERVGPPASRRGLDWSRGAMRKGDEFER
jgi:hypothetical protein